MSSEGIDYSGLGIVDNDTVNLEKGSILFIPPGTWHGVEYLDDSMLILLVVTPQGLEKLFRGIGSPHGIPIKKLTEKQMDSIEVESDSKVRKN